MVLNLLLTIFDVSYTSNELKEGKEATNSSETPFKLLRQYVD